MNFDQAFDIVVSPTHEGGYINDAHDPGGETKFGISKRAFPDADIPNMTLELAKTLYKKNYWDAGKIDMLPDAIRFEMFDISVNCGVGRAAKMLQSAVGVAMDGDIGPKTMKAVAGIADDVVLRRLQGVRILYYTSMIQDWWLHFGKGVMNRIAHNMTEL